MKKICIFVFVILAATIIATAQEREGFKVFISVDMEGISGIVNREEVRTEGQDYQYFRMVMTREANAAIAGAFDAGATEVWVKDGHATGRNILPEELDKRALLLRDWTGEWKGMMDGIDESFDAVVFVGYHAKAGTPNGILAHTMSSARIADIAINRISLPEAGINALFAGQFGVPVVFLSGDDVICSQATELLGPIYTVQTKTGMGKASLGLHPEVVREQIRETVAEAIRNRDRFKPWKLEGPAELRIRYLDAKYMKLDVIPGVEQTGELEITYKADELIDVLKAVRILY